MSTKEHLLKAREHIIAKRYQEARDILYQIDHPTATKWLTKLDEIDPPEIPKEPDLPMWMDSMTESPSVAQSLPDPEPIPTSPDPFTKSNYQKQKDKKGTIIPKPLAIAIIAGFIALCVCSSIGVWVFYQASEALGPVLAESQPRLDLGPDFGNPIQFGDSVNGSLSDPFPLQNWRFMANEGDTIVVTMKSADFDSLLELYDADGNFLTEDDDSGGEHDAQLVYTLPSSGEYIITATEWWSDIGIVGGSYELTLQRQ
ncbi:MAG: hypothetical protein GY943_29775 [Chloroflexi bacterium]|nr:hypothetical protein [Chloroflexota bacterium]